jgi:hypothetical protein
MNITSPESSYFVTAKTCGYKESIGGKQKLTYAFSDEFHWICIDKKEFIQAQIHACESLFRYVRNEAERSVIEKEISELRMARDLMT